MEEEHEDLDFPELADIKKLICQFTGISGEPYQKIVRVHKGKAGTIFTDGSSFGMREIYNSDVLLEMDRSTFKKVDDDTGIVFLDLYGKDNTPLALSPRALLKGLAAKVQEADYTFNAGPEMEFFLLPWDKEKKIPLFAFSDSDYYFAPLEYEISKLFDEAQEELEKRGVEVEAFHHEVAPGQYEVSFKYADAVTAADNVQTVKLVMKMISKRHGLYATFMPKPFFGVNGSGMHVHQSLATEDGNAFAGEQGLSDVALSFIAGQLLHAKALPAAIAPTVNSYKRLVPGYEAPVYACWSGTNRSAMIRVPLTDGNPLATRIELRCPDPSSNPYVAFTAMLAAGMDGVNQKMKAPEPVENVNVFKMSESEKRERNIPSLPSSLAEAALELEKDKVLMDAFGDFGPVYLEHLRKDAERYRLHVSELEREMYGRR